MRVGRVPGVRCSCGLGFGFIARPCRLEFRVPIAGVPRVGLVLPPLGFYA